MPVEIINTSHEALPLELEDILTEYPPYHIYEERRNRLWIRVEDISWDVRAVFVRVDEDHFVIWVSDWHAQPSDLY